MVFSKVVNMCVCALYIYDDNDDDDDDYNLV